MLAWYARRGLCAAMLRGRPVLRGHNACMTDHIPASGDDCAPAASNPASCADAVVAHTGDVLVLVDGSSYLYRAYHAMPDLRAVPGDPGSPATGALRGMVNMMQALRRDVSAELANAAVAEAATIDAVGTGMAAALPRVFAACVFDASGPTFRDALYPDYKAGRAPMPDDLRAQIAPIHEVVQLLGWTVLGVPGVEADDVIATLATLAAAQGVRVLVSSGDKDLSQLVNERITIIDTMSGKRRDVAGVMQEFGVPPQRMVDFQALVGDAVDNIPGVPKVGPKTAARWLSEYGTLDALVAQADCIKGVAGQNLRAHIASGQLALGRELVRMKTDCDLCKYVPGLPALDALLLRAPDPVALRPFYLRYGFQGLVRSLGDAPGDSNSAEQARGADAAQGAAGQAGSDVAAAVPEPHTAPVQVDIVRSEAALREWLRRIEAAPLTAIDTETDALHAMTARLVGISLCVEVGRAAYIPLAHNGLDVAEADPGAAQLPLEMVLTALRPWLEDASRPKLGQHIKFDQHVFANHGIRIRGYAHDTMLQSYVLEADRAHSLESLALRHCGRTGTSYEQLCGKGRAQVPFAQVPVQQAAAYAGEDADMTLAVHQVLWPRIQADVELAGIYALEMHTSDVLWRIERHGICIDRAQLAAHSRDLGERIHGLEMRAYELAGQPFNLASPKQLGEIFFDRLGLPVIKKTATGARSTDEEVLEKLAQDYPLPACILEHRSLSKLKNTYTDKLPGMALPDSSPGGAVIAEAEPGTVRWRIHTHFAQAVVATGRLASNEPNLQNIPIRTEEGRRIRRAFIAAPGHVVASADYSQIELRIMAHLSGDEALLEAFRTGQDIHRATAAEVFGVAPDQVSSEQRRYAKTINFGLIYGMGSFGLAKTLGIENQAAAAYIERYFQRYPGVREYMQATVAQAHAQGFVKTVFGRRLFLPDINAGSGPRKKAAERAAINAPMQGTAADLIKRAMVAVQQHLDAHRPQIRIVLQVHDELVFELPEADVPWLRTHIPALMAGVAELAVPLVAEVGVGRNWDEAH